VASLAPQPKPKDATTPLDARQAAVFLESGSEAGDRLYALALSTGMRRSAL
jgi:hypothetical protein